MHIATPLDLVYLGASIALVALALYWTHASENHAAAEEEHDKAGH
jgi:hypothetical protein